MKDEIGLGEMVVALRKELLQAQEEGDEKALKFKVDEIELDVELVTTKGGAVGAGVKFWVYNAEMKGKLEHARTHRLHLKLKPEMKGGDLRIADEDEK